MAVLTAAAGVPGRSPGGATTWLGLAGNGTRTKLVLNNWLADLTDGLERPQGTLGLFIISQWAKPWKASFRLVTWVICPRSRGSGR